MRARDETRDLIRRYYEAVDAGDVDAALGFFAPDATVRIGNADPVEGTEAIGRMLGGGLAAVGGTRHQVRGIWEEDGGLVVFEVDVVYTLGDGRTVTIHGSAFCTVADGRFTEQRLYADLSPVFG